MNPADEARRRSRLTDEQKARLATGEHEQLAAELASSEPEMSAWIFEQVWDFANATAGYRAAGLVPDALRCTLELRDPATTESTVAWIEGLGGDAAEAAAAVFEKKGLHDTAARLYAAASADEAVQAEALSAAGDPTAAARLLLEADRPREALDQLGELEENEGSGLSWNLAARCWWRLGDAHATARAAQAALRCRVTSTPDDAEEGDLLTLLAAALEGLGHSDAAEVVLSAREDKAKDSTSALAGGHGRYRVQTVYPAPLAGSAYLAIDRVTHQEVELHLLLADQLEQQTSPDPEALEAIQRFVERAERASTTRHPALRPILRADARSGLLVLPRADGPSLRAMIRPPGVLEHPARARAMIRFMLEGLASVHALGMAHGGVLPHLISTDALGRPVLGPAGSDALSGLAATRTGGLEELLSLSAPEMHRGGAATPAADVFSAGRIWAALLLGRLKFELSELPSPARELVASMTEPDPHKRPQARDLVAQLATPIADFRVLGSTIRPGESGVTMQPTADLDQMVAVEVAQRWSDEELAAICEHASPWMQTIMQRDGRLLWLAPWPEGCATLDPESQAQGKLHAHALFGLDDALRAKIRRLLRPNMMVRTPAGSWFIALDGLLADPAPPT